MQRNHAPKSSVLKLSFLTLLSGLFYIHVSAQGLSLSASTSNHGGYSISCHGGADGQISATVSGNSGSVNFVWAHGPTTAALDSLSAGDYTVIATDSIGDSDTLTVTLSQPSALSVSLFSPSYNGYNIHCAGGADGQISTSVSGGVSPYSYTWTTSVALDSTQLTSPNIGSLPSGVYQLLVTGANGCSATAEITLSQPSALSTGIVQGSAIACAGGTTSVDLSISGGVAPYIYNWSNGAIIQDLSAVASGPYHVRSEDANGCVKFDSLLINAPAPLVLDADWHRYPNGKLFSCDTCNDAQLTILLSGGVAPITSTLSSASGSQTGPVFTGLYADTAYSLVIVDALGCTLQMTGPQSLVVPRGGFSSLQINAKVSMYPGGYNVSTFGGNDGWIDLNISGQMSQETVLWSDGNTSRYRGGLGAGSYSVTVSDNAGQSVSQTFQILQPQSGMSVMLNGSYSSCNYKGMITAMVNGGTPPYSYTWFNAGVAMYDTWSSIQVYQPGLYALLAVDANGDSAYAEKLLEVSAEAWIELSSPILYGQANASCNGNDGRIEITIHGGSAPYMLEVYGQSYDSRHSNSSSNSQTNNRYFSTNDTVAVVDSLRAGWYEVRLKSPENCGGSNQTIELRAPEPLKVRVDASVKPNGYYLSCDSCADAEAQISVSNGSGQLQYAWIQVPADEQDFRLEGASLFQKDWNDLDEGTFDPSNANALGFAAQ